ncbi:MAG: glycosyl hydrolase [Bryobacteraceae bacterium]
MRRRRITLRNVMSALLVLMFVELVCGLAQTLSAQTDPPNEATKPVRTRKRLTPPVYGCEPVNPNATAEARALLKKLCSISGKVTLTGQHNYPGEVSQYSDRVAATAGKYPAIWGSDMGFGGGTSRNSVEYRESMIQEAIRQYQAGSIITLMWHAAPPIAEEPVPFSDADNAVQTTLTDDEWAALLRPGTEIHRRWLRQVDGVAAYLKKLQEARIPVLWRPYHEMNGTWFWWGFRPGPDGFVAVYRMMFDRFVNHHRLDNLLWVWNANAAGGSSVMAYHRFYPGDQYVDILATDIYGGRFSQKQYDDLLELANGRVIALGEVGEPPSPEVLEAQPRWAWFMGWAGHMDSPKFADAVKEVFNHPRTRSRGEPLPE